MGLGNNAGNAVVVYGDPELIQKFYDHVFSTIVLIDGEVDATFDSEYDLKDDNHFLYYGLRNQFIYSLNDYLEGIRICMRYTTGLRQRLEAETMKSHDKEFWDECIKINKGNWGELLRDKIDELVASIAPPNSTNPKEDDTMPTDELKDEAIMNELRIIRTSIALIKVATCNIIDAVDILDGQELSANDAEIITAIAGQITHFPEVIEDKMTEYSAYRQLLDESVIIDGLHHSFLLDSVKKLRGNINPPSEEEDDSVEKCLSKLNERITALEAKMKKLTGEDKLREEVVAETTTTTGETLCIARGPAK